MDFAMFGSRCESGEDHLQLCAAAHSLLSREHWYILVESKQIKSEMHYSYEGATRRRLGARDC